MFGHRCVVVLDELFDDEELDPVDPDDSSAFVAFATATFGVFACAGAVAALAIAAPPNPSPNAPETTAAAMRGFFIRMLHLLLSAHIRGLDHGGLPWWPFDRTNLEQTCGRRVAHLRFDESVANGQVSDPATVDLLAAALGRLATALGFAMPSSTGEGGPGPGNPSGGTGDGSGFIGDANSGFVGTGNDDG